MVFLDNVRQFFKDHPERYGPDPSVPFVEFLTHLSPASLMSGDSREDNFETFVQTTVIASGEAEHILGEDNFKLFAADLQLPTHRIILGRAFTKST